MPFHRLWRTACEQRGVQIDDGLQGGELLGAVAGTGKAQLGGVCPKRARALGKLCMAGCVVEFHGNFLGEMLAQLVKHRGCAVGGKRAQSLMGEGGTKRRIGIHGVADADRRAARP